MATINEQERPRHRAELAAWYSELLRDQASGGLSVAEFAATMGMAPTTLYQWKRRLARTTPSRAERRVKPVAPKGLIQLSLQEQPAPTEHAGFVVRLPSGRLVEVPSQFDDDALQRLLLVLDRC